MILKVKTDTELKNALKLASLVESGGVSKHLIKDGAVKLNGEIEVRPSKKLHAGEKIEFNGQEIIIEIV